VKKKSLKTFKIFKLKRIMGGRRQRDGEKGQIQPFDRNRLIFFKLMGSQNFYFGGNQL